MNSHGLVPIEQETQLRNLNGGEHSADLQGLFVQIKVIQPCVWDIMSLFA